MVEKYDYEANHKQAATGETIKPFVYKELIMAHFLMTTNH
jgi:hypothetical protein